MTYKKKNIYNLNLFILIVFIGFLMHWQKNIRNKHTESNIIAQDSPISTNNSLKSQVVFKK